MDQEEPQGPIKCLWWQLMRVCIRQPLETDCTNFAKWSSVEILKGPIKVQILVRLKCCGDLEVGNTCNKPFKDHIVKNYLLFHLYWTKVFLSFLLVFWSDLYLALYHPRGRCHWGVWSLYGWSAGRRTPGQEAPKQGGQMLQMHAFDRLSENS